MKNLTQNFRIARFNYDISLAQQRDRVGGMSTTLYHIKNSLLLFGLAKKVCCCFNENLRSYPLEIFSGGRDQKFRCAQPMLDASPSLPPDTSRKRLAMNVHNNSNNWRLNELAKIVLESVAEIKKVPFVKLCTEYLQFSSTNKTVETHRRDIVIIKNLMKTFKKKLITEITTHDLEIYKNKRIGEVKPATVNREVACLKNMFNKAVQWGHLIENPVQTVRLLKEPPGRVRYLNGSEIERLLSHCAQHIRYIVIVALNTGMRKGEILNLKWQDIDMQNRMIIIKRTKNNEMRMIPINNILHNALNSNDLRSNSQYVFANKNGEKFGDIKTGFRAALRRAGITDFRFHDLRHTFASRLVMAGVDIRTVQTLMGHKDIKMTMRYSHLSNDHIKEAVGRLDVNSFTQRPAV